MNKKSIFLWALLIKIGALVAMEKPVIEISPAFVEYYELYDRLIRILDDLPFDLTQYHKEYEGVPISGSFGPILVDNYRNFNLEFLVVTVPAYVLEDSKLSSLKHFFEESMAIRLTCPPYCISEKINNNFICRLQIKSSSDMYLTQRIKKDFQVRRYSVADKLKLLDVFL